MKFRIIIYTAFDELTQQIIPFIQVNKIDAGRISRTAVKLFGISTLTYDYTWILDL